MNFSGFSVANFKLVGVAAVKSSNGNSNLAKIARSGASSKVLPACLAIY